MSCGNTARRKYKTMCNLIDCIKRSHEAQEQEKRSWFSFLNLEAMELISALFPLFYRERKLICGFHSHPKLMSSLFSSFPVSVVSIWRKIALHVLSLREEDILVGDSHLPFREEGTNSFPSCLLSSFLASAGRAVQNRLHISN